MMSDRARSRPAGPAGPPLGADARRAWSGRSRPTGCRPRPRRAGSSWSQGTTLRPVDPATGTPLWTADLGGAAGLGRLPGRPDHRRDRDPAGRTGASRRGRSSGSTTSAPRTAAAAAPTRSPGPSRRRAAGDAGAARLHDFRIVGRPRLLPPRRPRADRLRRRHRAGRLVVLPARPARSTRTSGSARSGSCSRSASRTRSWSSRPPTAAAAPSIPRARTRSGPGPRCRSTTTTSRWCADRRTVALFDLRRGVNAWNFRESLELPKHGAAPLLGDAERLLVIHDGSD